MSKLKFYSHFDCGNGPGSTIYLFSKAFDMLEVQEPKLADIIIWNGGEDIGTSIYGETPIHRGIPANQSRRDRDEIAMFNQFKDDESKFLFGICRGAQLLNCLNGGKLWQDVNGHNGSHSMLDVETGETFQVTSTHHQQMIAAPKGAEVIGVSSLCTYKDREAGMSRFNPGPITKGEDLEIVWYPATRSLCIQGHPEYVPNSRFAAYTLELIQAKRLASSRSPDVGAKRRHVPTAIGA